MEKPVVFEKTGGRNGGRVVVVDAERLSEIKNHWRVQLISK